MAAPHGEKFFVKCIGKGKYNRFYAEKENLASRYALRYLGPDHAPETHLVADMKESVYPEFNKRMHNFTADFIYRLLAKEKESITRT